MHILFFAAAVALLLVGHCFRMLRWRQLIGVYEKPGRAALLRALATGYTVNFFVPYRAGDLVRAILTGRRLENGFPFALSTILVDYGMDVPVIGAVFSVLLLVAPDAAIRASAVWYGVLLCVLAAGVVLALCCSGPLKRAAAAVCSVFNPHIEFKLLFFFWSCITACRDCLLRASKKKLFFNTAVMWATYLCSYFCLARALTLSGIPFGLRDVLVRLFSSSAYRISMAAGGLLTPAGRTDLLFFAYTLLTLALLFALSFLPRTAKDHLLALHTAEAAQTAEKTLHLLPQVEEKDRLRFLELYFSNTRRDYLRRYLELNREVHILQDYSAGSNATTMLCMDEQKTFYRKYAFGADGEKLQEQLTWLHRQKGRLPLPEILTQQKESGYCCYDMAYDAAAVGMFQYLHSNEPQRGWQVLRRVLEDLDEQLYRPTQRPADAVALDAYIEGKVWKNVARIEASREIAPLLAYDTLQINGKVCRSFAALKRWLERGYLHCVFQDDPCGEIHGDLTVENIIVWETRREPPYYLIDPNTGNLHESPFLDYAKLLQSLHGGYEFLMRTNRVEVEGNRITFLFPCSHIYTELFGAYRAYLEQRFPRAQVRSIFFHEVVHWLRLMPYKIEKNGRRAVLFFAGLLLVFNDVVDWYGEETDERQAGDL